MTPVTSVSAACSASASQALLSTVTDQGEEDDSEDNGSTKAIDSLRTSIFSTSLAWE